MSRVYRDPLYADELAGKAPERARIHRKHGFLASGGGGGDGASGDGAQRTPPPNLRATDPRGVLAAINDYELMRAFGGWWQLTGEHPDVVTIARMQLVMAGIADAERKMQDEAADDAGSGRSGRSGASPPAPPPGTTAQRQEQVSVARSQYTRKVPVVRGPDPLAS